MSHFFKPPFEKSDIDDNKAPLPALEGGGFDACTDAGGGAGAGGGGAAGVAAEEDFVDFETSKAETKQKSI